MKLSVYEHILLVMYVYVNQLVTTVIKDSHWNSFGGVGSDCTTGRAELYCISPPDYLNQKWTS